LEGTTMTKNETTIQEMICRHRELYRAMDRLYDLGGDDATDLPEHRAAMVESIELENRIVATPSKSRVDDAAKRRFITQTNFITANPGLAMGDLHDLVEMILRLDAERVGAGR
jgi:hypothetical protein